jgi:hypothetical protein
MDMDRNEAIKMLRTELLLRIGNEDVSACTIATRQGIFCRGFARFSDAELRDRYQWIVRRRPNMSRKELEEIADRWQLARQDVRDKRIACDVQQEVSDMCRGWDSFSNDELARFYFEMTGQGIVIS